MLKKTHSKIAPWIVLRSDDKFAARKEAIKHILNSIKYENKNNSLSFQPDKDVTISVKEELRLMSKEGKY
jgi:hypothetical protein